MVCHFKTSSGNGYRPLIEKDIQDLALEVKEFTRPYICVLDHPQFDCYLWVDADVFKSRLLRAMFL